MYKVSVIVPVYNVERYLDRCLTSIINQTYKNLEIILVNDGSTDNSREIAKGYTTLDNRVKLYDKQNGGLSDARNYGINKATGDYVLYVDSDDWLDITMIETMVEEVKKYNADVVQVDFYYAYEDHLLYDDRYNEIDGDRLILDNKNLMKELIKNEKIKNFAWGKLYKLELVKDILFEKGMRFEDVFWAHQVMHNVEKYVLLHKPLMYYLQRSESISGSYKVENTDIIKGLIQRHSFIKENYKNLEDESYKLILKTCFVHYDMLLRIKDKRAKMYREGIEQYIDENYGYFRQAVKSDKYTSNELKYFKINPYLRLIYVYCNKILRKLKIRKSEPSLKRIELYETNC